MGEKPNLYRDSDLINFHPDTIENMEMCCKLNIQCDMQKRFVLFDTSIDSNIRHCECENKFRECLSSKNTIKTGYSKVSYFGDVYSRQTASCYSVDHPIVKCEQFKCFYQPETTYK